MNQNGKFTRGRVEESLRGQDAVNRARQATNAAVDQSKDRLGTPGESFADRCTRYASATRERL